MADLSDEEWLAKTRAELWAARSDDARIHIAFAEALGRLDAATRRPCAHHAFVIKNGFDTHYRTIDQCGITWTTDAAKALHFARREDAERFCAEDEDAWIIREVGMAAACAHQGPYREACITMIQECPAKQHDRFCTLLHEADQQAAAGEPSTRERQLEEALRTWLPKAPHLSGCSAWKPEHRYRDKCSCGLSQIRAVLTPAARGTTTTEKD